MNFVDQKDVKVYCIRDQLAFSVAVQCRPIGDELLFSTFDD